MSSSDDEKRNLDQGIKDMENIGHKKYNFNTTMEKVKLNFNIVLEKFDIVLTS